MNRSELPYIQTDAMFLDDNGTIIWTQYVDFRSVGKRTLIAKLAKAGERRFAIEKTGTIRITKQSGFWNFGEGLIQDSDEGKAENVTRKTQISRRDWANGLEQSFKHKGIELSVGHTTEKWVDTESVTYGKNGWIFSTSVAPTTEEDIAKWIDNLDSKYDYYYYISRRRAFARELALMLARQLGPLSMNGQIESTVGGKVQSVESTKGQMVFHGPVVYVDSVFEYIDSLQSEDYKFLASCFLKRREYNEQNEFRFIVYCENEPEENTIDLQVSDAMRDALCFVSP